MVNARLRIVATNSVIVRSVFKSEQNNTSVVVFTNILLLVEKTMHACKLYIIPCYRLKPSWGEKKAEHFYSKLYPC